MLIKKPGAFHLKPILSILLVLIMALGGIFLGTVPTAEAKTTDSARAENIFFYVTGSEGKNVLLDVMSYDELNAISHGQLSEGLSGTDTGTNYYYSCTDNLPTTVYAEARGLTLPDLVAYVRNHSAVAGAEAIAYTGSDKLYFMATDSYGIYNKNWSYDQLYGQTVYYFPGLFNAWTDGWEISDSTYSPTDSSPIPLEIYNASYQASDPYYQNKRDVFSGGRPAVTILATQLEIDRAFNLSSEIAANGGNITGCLHNALTSERALQLCIPQSEAVLMSGNRTAYHYFAWVYNLKLAMAGAPVIASLGTVAAPTAEVTQNGDTLSTSMDCATEGAKIYYSLTDAAPQTLYTGEPVTCDVSGRDLATNPVTFYMTAVKEGYDDAGIISATYPQRAPALTDIYTATVGDDLTFAATSAVSAEAWTDWSGSLTSVGLRYPGASGYTPLEEGQYTTDNSSKTITFDKALFSTYGTHSFQVCADGYANKTMSVTMKKPAPDVISTDYYMDSDILLSFADANYQAGMSVSIEGMGTGSSPIGSSYLIRSIPGKLTIKNTYFSAPNCAITVPGTYTLTLTNSNYAPGSQTVEITVKDASQKPSEDTFAYTLTPGAANGKVGDPLTVNVALTSSADNYNFYAGEYRLVLDNTSLTLGTVKPGGNWQSGTKTADGRTTLTFAALDLSGQGTAGGSSTEIGSFRVEPLQEGIASILCSRALLTDENAGALSEVSGSGLEITITETDLLTPPELTADGDNNVLGRDITVSFTDDEVWRSALTGVSVDGMALDSGKYTVTAGTTIEPGTITINQSVFMEAKNYTVTVSAEGYQDAEVIQPVQAHNPAEGDGDINGDGSVGIQDVQLGIDYMMGKTTPDGGELSSADLNGDGSVGIQDVLGIIDMMMGK